MGLQITENDATDQLLSRTIARTQQSKPLSYWKKKKDFKVLMATAVSSPNHNVTQGKPAEAFETRPSLVTNYLQLQYKMFRADKNHTSFTESLLHR